MAESGFKERFYPESRFGGFTDIDGTVAFYARVNALVDADSVVVDVGCGRGRPAEEKSAFKRDLVTLRGRVAKVIGIDLDPDGAVNPTVDEFRLIEGDTWPLETASADLCYCDNVLEHIEDPDAFFREARRVLRPGGHLCARTSNKWNYASLAARLVPNRHHAKVLKSVEEKKKEAHDVFPTRFVANTIPTLRRLLKRWGFDGVVRAYESEPAYMSFAKAAYWLGVMHQKFAPRFMGSALFLFARRDDEPYREGSSAKE